MEEPPAIRAVSSFQRDRTHDRSTKGSFAAIGKLHKQIEADFVYDPAIGRFTPKNAMGAAAETLDVLHQAKEDAEKSGLYKKMQSGNPDDLFDAAEAYGKVFAKLAEGALRPRNPADLQDAGRVGQAAVTKGCEGTGDRGGGFDAALAGPAQEVVSEPKSGRSFYL